jgi:uncharacterized protein (DUF1697 family)
MKYVALLRGINVGGNRAVRMDALRNVVEAAGGTNVATYIQSGNVVFDHASRAEATLTTKLAGAIARTFRFTGFSLTLRTAAELAAVVEDNPFPRARDGDLHVMVLPAPVPRSKLESLDGVASKRERFDVVGRELYLCLPDGLGRSKLAAAANRHKALAGATARNWRTVQALIDLAGGAHSAKLSVKSG